MHVVTLRGQTDEGATHGNHVVVRVRGEDENRLGEGVGTYRTGAVVGIGFAARPSGNGVLEVVKDVNVNLVKLTHLFQELAQTVVLVVLFGEFEDGLAGYFAQPHHGFSNKLGRPVAGTHQPGGHAAGELLGGGLIHVEGDVVVILQQGGRAVGGHGTFGNGLHGGGLVFAPGHQDNLFGAQERADTHGNGLVGGGHDVHVEVNRLALSGAVGQAHHAGAGFLVGTGFVEAHLALLANTNHHQVHSAGLGVKVGAIGSQFFGGNVSVGDVDVLLQDIHFVQQVVVDAEITALLTAHGSRIVFVNGYHFHVLERDLAGLVAAYQFVIQRLGGSARSEAQAEKTAFVGVNGIYN